MLFAALFCLSEVISCSYRTHIHFLRAHISSAFSALPASILDSTATSLCMDNNIPLVVFAMEDPDNIIKIVKGEQIGTIIEN